MGNSGYIKLQRSLSVLRFGNANKISCEGLVLGTVCVTAFRTGIDKAMHQDMYCYCHKYKLCPVARAVFGKYKGE